MAHIQIAVDGPSGAGKSTLARAAAKALGIVYVDTGALYRALGYFARSRGIPRGEIARVVPLLPEARVGIEYEDGVQHVYLNGEDLGDRIRENEISMYASAVSALPEARAFLLETQRRIARERDVIMDGRDIGTVILPDAPVKIFMTAPPEARARRRCAELEAKGMPVPYGEVLADILERDRRDETRETAPAVPAADAVPFDNSEEDLGQSERDFLSLIRRTLAAKGLALP